MTSIYQKTNKKAIILNILKVLFMIFVLFITYAPLLIIALMSINMDATANSFTGITLKWYSGLFNNHELLKTIFVNTVLVAVISTICATIFGTLTAIGINSLSKKVEEDLAKAFPDIDNDYQKTLTNMTKTLKEIAKYKRINNLVIKGKIMLFKMAKFNFGEKFIQKLKKVEEGNKTNNKPVNKQKSKVEAPSLDILNNFSSETNKFQSKDTLNISKAFSGISFRSGFTQSSFNDERNNNENMNEDSLDSIDEQNNIKFSPGGNNQPNRDASGNIEQILEHTYDPFNSEKINSSYLLFPILTLVLLALFAGQR